MKRKIFIKKVVTLAISACITFSNANVIFAANDIAQRPDGLSLLTYEEYQAATENIDAQVQAEPASVDTSDNKMYLTESDEELPISKENLDFDSVRDNIIRIDNDGNPVAETEEPEEEGVVLGENNDQLVEDVGEAVPFTAPQSGITPSILNPESLKDGKITTDTQIVWLVDFFDADGDTLVNYAIDGFPLRYLVGGVIYQDGFITQFTDPGKYSVLYQAIDSNGELGEVQGWSLEVVPVESYQTIEDSLSSASDRKTYTVDIDFSKMDAATIALVRSGNSQIDVTVTDAAGNEVKMGGATTKRWGYIDKPADGGVCTYTVSVYCNKTQSFVEGSSNFRLNYGDKKDTEAMLSGPENAVRLEKFTNVKGNFMHTGYTPNKDQNWFRFTADGSTVFTLLTYYPELRFQICDTNNLSVMFDSNSENNNSVHRTNFLQGWAGVEKARINTAAGQEYYLVLYTPSQISPLPMVEKTINVAVGLPHMAPEQTEWFYGNSITANSSSFSGISYVDIGDGGKKVPRTALANEVQWAGTRPSNIKYFRVREPGGNSWRNSAMYGISQKMGYVTDSNSNKNINGTWQLGFQGSLDPVSFVPQFKVYYYYEIGD